MRSYALKVYGSMAVIGTSRTIPAHQATSGIPLSDPQAPGSARRFTGTIPAAIRASAATIAQDIFAGTKNADCPVDGMIPRWHYHCPEGWAKAFPVP